MNEQRKHWFKGLSPANVIVLITIIMTGSVAWGVQITQSSENAKNIAKLEKESKQELQKTEQRITTEIKESEQRTNERINRMENRLGGDMKELKRLIINK